MPPSNCVVCRSPKLGVIDDMLAAGAPLARIEMALRAQGIPIKRETLKRHQLRCEPPSLPVAAPGAPDPATGRRDFATMVQARAAQAMDLGILRVTTKDGLAAQAILDRRAEKEQDRNFMLGLARLLSGGGQPAPAQLLPGDAIEGQFSELPNPALAPPELRE